ncbi:uncharacterized protein A4U43_C04F25570, partial [Asparagus officinalis]
MDGGIAEAVVPIPNQEAEEGKKLTTPLPVTTPGDQVDITILNEESPARIKGLKSVTSNCYDTLWDLTCHYHVALACANPLSKKTRPQISLKKFADDLFKNLESNSDETIRELGPLTPSVVNELIKKSNAQSYTTTGIEGDFPTGTKFQTFLWYAMKPIQPMTLLAGYPAIWLKKCVVPYQFTDALPIEVLYPAVQLAHRKSLSLLPTMIADINRGLCQIISTFTQKGSKPLVQIQTVKVELSYTYLMVWFVLHRSDMMSAPSAVDQYVPLLQLIEK